MPTQQPPRWADLPTRYDHHDEMTLYGQWESSGQFKPSVSGEPFTMVIPPPNVTGELHLGHALTYAIEDAIARNRRRRGYRVLLVPGVDHASIAVHHNVERKIEREKGVTRQQLGRQAFLEEVWQWVNHYLPKIQQAMRRFGLSCDWDRFRFTMDEPSSLAVRTAFVQLFQQGLIYRGQAIVNWDPKMQTTVSDDEVEYVEEISPFYTLRYGPFQIGTVRPETKFGDKYVVMHPDDARYRSFRHGQTFQCEWINGPVTATVIKDKAVDPAFGTGVMTITPWHDPLDFAIAQRHQLDTTQIIDLRGRLRPIAGEFAGLTIAEARPKIISKLQQKGLLVKTEERYRHRVALNYRGGGRIEPQILDQWFVKTTALAEQARAVVKTGQVRFVQKSLERVYFHWLDQLHDWCISRQLWWGHRIPAWYCEEGEKKRGSPACQEPIVALEAPIKCPHCHSKALRQDPDVLDTWFSSALWPFSTLGWPNKTAPDLRQFFPTTLMETGTDILFFWVSRMIMLSLALTGQVPFKEVYFHGLVLDEKKQKMSKSKGNALDPLALIEQYGADAVRLSLIGGGSTELAKRFSEAHVLKYRNFVTKIWNASRFVASLSARVDLNPQAARQKAAPRKQKVNIEPNDLDATEQRFFVELEQLEGDYQRLLDRYQLTLALEKLYDFFWHRFSDQLLEYEKKAFNQAANRQEVIRRHAVLRNALQRQLDLLSDFAPFVTARIKTVMFDD